LREEQTGFAAAGHAMYLCFSIGMLRMQCAHVRT